MGVVLQGLVRSGRPTTGGADRITTMTNGYDLSRRKVLLGLGTIGAAGAGAGLGTSAYFNDEETFEENSIEAGTFSMEVELLDREGAVDQDGMGPDEDDWYSKAEGDNAMVGASIDIGDLKPGDTYEFCWCIRVYDNPGVVRAFIPGDSVTSKNGADAGNVSADDIHDVDDDDDFENLLGSEDITVSKNLRVCEGDELGKRFFDEDITYGPDDSEEYDHDGGLGNWVSSLSNWENSSQDGVPIGSHNGEGHRNDDNLDEGEADYILIGSDGDDKPLDAADYGAVAYCMEIDVSKHAGNELQGAELSFNLQFLAEQARHNDHPFSDMATRPAGDLDSWDQIPL